MEAVMTARHNEPWRKEFVHARELRERGRKEGYEEGRAEQFAADQAEIAALKAEIERLKGSAQ